MIKKIARAKRLHKESLKNWITQVDQVNDPSFLLLFAVEDTDRLS